MAAFLQNDSAVCIIGDVGGTNVRLQVMRISQRKFDKAEVLKAHVYHTSDFPEFADFIADFLKDIETPEYAVIGIAGPINNNTVLMANTKWSLVDGTAIGKQFKLKQLMLINDFQSVAYGVLGLEQDDLIPLNNGVPQKGQCITVVGPGTGLGVSRLFPVTLADGTIQYDVWPCEGGHVHYSPSNDLEVEFLQYLRQQLKLQHIVAEKAMAGPSIPYIYTFLKQKYPTESVIEKEIDSEKFRLGYYAEHNRGLSHYPSKDIFAYGVNKKDAICQRTVEFFLNSYGTVIGDLICNSLPFSGVYLFGGISMTVAQYILDNPNVNFLQQYAADRPHMKDIFEKIPIYVMKKIDLGLDGAYQAALRMLEQHHIKIK